MRTPHLATIVALLLFVALVSCADRVHVAFDAPALTVRVVSDYRAGSETTRIVVDVFEGEQSASSQRLTQATRNLDLSDALDRGIDVAEIVPIAAGTYTARATLLRASGEALASRTVVVEVAPPQTITVHLTRDCLGVVCPNSASASQTECSGGVCVDPRCTAATPEHCPGMKADCVSNDDCAGEGVCSTNECVEGVCIDVATSGECDETEYCAGPEGCAPIDGQAMPTGPDPRCGLICRIPVEPCRYGYYACDGTSVVCTPFTTRPTGAPCGDGNVCSPAGECVVAPDAGEDAAIDMELPFDMGVVPFDMSVPVDMTPAIDMNAPMDMSVTIDMNAPMDMSVTIDMTPAIDMNAPMDMSVAIDMTPDMTPDMEPDMPTVIRACNDGFDNDGDGTVDMDDPDCEEPLDDDEFTPLEEDCSRLWQASADWLYSNIDVVPTPTQTFVTGAGTGFCFAMSLNVASGAQNFGVPNVGCMPSGVTRDDLAVFQRFSGPSATDVLNLNTKTVSSSFAYAPSTAGWSASTPMAISSTGRILTAMFVVPSEIGTGTPVSDWTMNYGGGGSLSGSGDSLLLDVHAANGALERTFAFEELVLPLELGVLPDDTWLLSVRNASTSGGLDFLGATLDTTVQLVAVAPDLSVATRIASGIRNQFAVIPGTSHVAVASGSEAGVRVIEATGATVWERSWCTGSILGASTDYVFIAVEPGQTACGYRLVGYDAADSARSKLIVRLDAATGEVVDARRFRGARNGQFAVASDGALYFYDGSASELDVGFCGAENIAGAGFSVWRLE
jgi:hypothetical protein